MKRLLAIATILYFATTVSAQEALKSTEEEYYDFLSLSGKAERPTLGYRTLSDSEWIVSDENHIWSENNLGSKYSLYENENPTDNFFMRGVDQSVKVKIYGPEWFNSYNTAAPYGQNDGALWQGKGYNTSFTAGARLEAYGLELTFKPQVSFSQNSEFDLMYDSTKQNDYRYFWSNVDLPQRFGDKAFSTFDWGDSEVRYNWNCLTVGFGTQSAWVGPAWLNPILGSNNAATYPKVDVGLRKTKLYMPFSHWDIGYFETRVWTGYLTESDYYDDDDDNNHNMVHAMTFAYTPSFAENFTIGFSRIILYKWKNENLKGARRLFSLSHTNSTSTGNDEDQKFSVFLDFLFPSVGFEVYGELGKDDFSESNTTSKDHIADILTNPFHTLCFTIGSKKSFKLRRQKSIFGEVIFEWSSFEMSQDFQLQWSYFGFYGHSYVSQGYTNKGQIIGAGSGYAGNSQFLGINLYYPKGNTLFFFHRNAPDMNFIHSKAVNASAVDSNGNYVLAGKYWSTYKTIVSFGVYTRYFCASSISCAGGLVYSLILNNLYYHENREKGTSQITKDNNFTFQFGVKYNF